jgi:hypothetical protein
MKTKTKPEDQKIMPPIRLPRKLVAAIREEARMNKRSMDDLAKFVFEDFFSAWTPEERAGLYKVIPEKVYGQRRTKRPSPKLLEHAMVILSLTRRAGGRV